MVYSYRSVMVWIAVLGGLSAVQLAASSWPEEFAQRYEAHGLALLHTNEADWVQRTNEYGAPPPDTCLPDLCLSCISIYGVKWGRCTEQLSQSPSL